MRAEDRRILNKLLDQGGRIDERTQDIKTEIGAIKNHQTEINKTLGQHQTDIAILKKEHKDPFHKGAFLGTLTFFGKILGFVK